MTQGNSSFAPYGANSP